MNFIEALNAFIGRRTEIVQPGQFLQGQLSAAAGGLITVQLSSSNYIPSSQQVTAFINNVTYVRILP
ncbi:hypothetical protein NYE48_13290 [Paenibacillus sp. FSL M7-1455]|uniref:DUF2642 domain-containing protein n=1 Tax=Paenibacillus cookii TaxID=157839 RepID=A0ABQ4LW74_9BACL|nr:hypothetical protein [Paenibacillus cookii]KHF35498.1 hypothetical protein CM49_02258 [Paenibacillus sp. P1XP2]GIO67403.1 hypothetical protein J21TS3_22240 [Paenibacillus cookii]